MATYTGGLLPNGVRHGRGTLTYPNRYFKYTGEWVNGVKHGHGILFLGDGSSYEGNFVAGEIEGQGLRRWPDGSTYSGEFHLGEICGEGVLIKASGEQYEGSWLDNRWEGEGEWLSAEGDEYVGRFSAHKRHGQGKLRCANGDEYDGTWEQGVRHGEGTARWANGDYYEGEWDEDQRHGHGTFADGVSGVQYCGEWFKDVPTVVPEELRVHLPNATMEDADTDATQLLAAAAGKQLPPLRVLCEAYIEVLHAPEMQRDEAKKASPSPIDESSEAEGATNVEPLVEAVIATGESGRLLVLRILRRSLPNEGAEPVLEPTHFFVGEERESHEENEEKEAATDEAEGCADHISPPGTQLSLALRTKDGEATFEDVRLPRDMQSGEYSIVVMDETPGLEADVGCLRPAELKFTL